MNTLEIVPILAAATTQPWYSFARPNSLQDVTSAAAILIASFAIVQTHRQLRANAKSGDQQQKNIEKQQEQIERQLNHQAEQSITGPFFEMLDLHQSMIETTEVARNFGIRQGRDAFLALYQSFVSDENYQIPAPNGNDPQRRQIEIRGKYREFHRHNQIYLSHYFRYLYNIVKYVDDSTLSDDRKMDLVRILRAQLSQHQLLLLYYNGLTDELGYPNFFRYIRTYDLLDNLDKSDLKVESDRDLYKRLPMPPKLEPKTNF